MDAVGDAAFEMINEIRRQFREIPGLLEGTGEAGFRKVHRYCNPCRHQAHDHACCAGSRNSACSRLWL